MNFLLDTHTLLWFLTNDSKLSPKSELIIRNIDNRCYISIASFWEISIKHSLGKLELTGGIKKLAVLIEDSQIEFLHLAPEHIIAYAKLDFLHRDPFDRMIVAQSIVENLVIISKDSSLSLYKTEVIW